MRILKSASVFDAKNYERARIPGIVSLSSGTVIAYCELRQSDSDWAVIDIGMRKSTDGGNTFGELHILVSGCGRDTVNNPVMIADADTLHFLYCLNYHRVFYMKSTDEGESWSAPAALTADIRRQSGDCFFSCIATGPCHGIRLLSGELLVPVWLAQNHEDEKSHHPSVIAVLYSADRGKTWKITSPSAVLHDPSEFLLAQLPDGRIFANIRHVDSKMCRAVATLGNNFIIEGISFCEALPDPVCCAGFVSYKNGFLFSNCESTTERERLTIKRLTAEYEITDSLLLSKSAGYSDIAVSPCESKAYVLCEQDREIMLFVVELQ